MREMAKREMAMVSGTIKRQKGHFVRVERTTNFIEREAQKHTLLGLPLNIFVYIPHGQK
jgi:hypothetical protein